MQPSSRNRKESTHGGKRGLSILPGATLPTPEPEPEHDADEMAPDLSDEAAESVRHLTWLLHNGELEKIVSLFASTVEEKRQLQSEKVQLKKQVAALELNPILPTMVDVDVASGRPERNLTDDGNMPLAHLLRQDREEKDRRARTLQIAEEYENQRILDEKRASWFVFVSIFVSAFASWLVTVEPPAGGYQ